MSGESGPRTEYAVLCADGRSHYGSPTIDRERVVQELEMARHSSEALCGPHRAAQRTVPAWSDIADA